MTTAWIGFLHVRRDGDEWPRGSDARTEGISRLPPGLRSRRVGRQGCRTPGRSSPQTARTGFGSSSKATGASPSFPRGRSRNARPAFLLKAPCSSRRASLRPIVPGLWARFNPPSCEIRTKRELCQEESRPGRRSGWLSSHRQFGVTGLALPANARKEAAARSWSSRPRAGSRGGPPNELERTPAHHASGGSLAASAISSTERSRSECS